MSARMAEEMSHGTNVQSKAGEEVGAKTYTCRLCMDKFLSASKLLAHMKSGTNYIQRFCSN